VVLAGRGRLMIDGHDTDVSAHVVTEVPRQVRRSVRAADDESLDYLSIHRRRGPLGIRRGATGPAATGASHDEGGDPACWAHLFEDDAGGQRGTSGPGPTPA
jgi:hypothetical protein